MMLYHYIFFFSFFEPLKKFLGNDHDSVPCEANLISKALTFHTTVVNILADLKR